MATPITFSGFNQIDFNVILNAVMTQESQPLVALQTQQTTLQTTNSNYGQLASKLDALSTATDALSKQSSLVTYAAASSDSNAVGVSASSSAVAGSLRRDRERAGGVADLGDHVDRRRRQHHHRGHRWNHHDWQRHDQRQRPGHAAGAQGHHQRRPEFAGRRLDRPDRARGVSPRPDRQEQRRQQQLHDSERADRVHRRLRRLRQRRHLRRHRLRRDRAGLRRVAAGQQHRDHEHEQFGSGRGAGRHADAAPEGSHQDGGRHGGAGQRRGRGSRADLHQRLQRSREVRRRSGGRRQERQGRHARERSRPEVGQEPTAHGALRRARHRRLQDARRGGHRLHANRPAHAGQDGAHHLARVRPGIGQRPVRQQHDRRLQGDGHAHRRLHQRRRLRVQREEPHQRRTVTARTPHRRFHGPPRRSAGRHSRRNTPPPTSP